MTLFKGSGVAIVTPFTNEGVDYEKLEKLLNWHVEKGTDAIIICGTTGEAATMSESEKLETIEHTVKVIDGRIPVIAGTGTNNTAQSIELSKKAEEIGVDGLLVVSPYYNKSSQEGLVQHFEAIADAVNIPIILYNVPGRTGVNIDPKTVEKLASHKNIQGIKEASGDLAQVVEIARLVPEDFYIYSGNDDSIVPLLSVGGVGVISVVANILPTETSNMVHYYLEGKTKEAMDLQLNMKPLIDALFIEVNPIPVKDALNIIGAEVGKPRLPLIPMQEETRKVLEEEIEKYGVEKVNF